MMAETLDALARRVALQSAQIQWLTAWLVKAGVPEDEIQEHIPRYPHAGTFISEAERRRISADGP